MNGYAGISVSNTFLAKRLHLAEKVAACVSENEKASKPPDSVTFNSDRRRKELHFRRLQGHKRNCGGIRQQHDDTGHCDGYDI
jgi:hypothetical protein